MRVLVKLQLSTIPRPLAGDVKSQTAGSSPIRPDNDQKSILSGRSDGLTITQQLVTDLIVFVYR
jgi:hypothetical protein